jgi:HAD superfamily hydrolase (TIGR01509 family)
MRSTLKPAALAFDLDGVLVDSEAVNVRSAFEAFAQFGHELREEDAGGIVGLHPVDYVPGLAARFGMGVDARRELMRRQDAIYRRLWEEEVRPTEAAVETVEKLHRSGRRMALATSSGREHAARCLERLGLTRAFEFVLTKDDVGRRKPDPEVYLVCARRFALAPRELLVVEDSPVGVEAALAAGARCAALRTALASPSALGSADVVLESLAELPELLR